jgi:hypothetical protein
LTPSVRDAIGSGIVRIQRVPIRFALLVCLAALGAAACDPPPEVVTTAAVAETSPAKAPLPKAVLSRIAQLQEMAGQGDYRALAKLADMQPGFRSNDGGLAHRDYWRLKVSAGDDPTKQLVRLLAEPPAIVDGVEGRSYVWPALAVLRPAEVTPEIEGRIDQMLGAGQGAAFRQGAQWSGYTLAIREDGAWLWFVNGNG